MLILTRSIGENLMIGDEVVVSVLGVKGNQVRIGIQAPRDLPVHREEIYRRIEREQGLGAPVSSFDSVGEQHAALVTPATDVPTVVKRHRLTSAS